MAITKVDGRMFLDSGTVIVSGEASVEVQIDRDDFKHQVALKFRTMGGDEPEVRAGNPRQNRTVIHFIDFPPGETLAADYVRAGKIGQIDLRLSYVIQNFMFSQPTNVWLLTYTLYAGVD